MRQNAWRTTTLVTTAIGLALATGLLAGRVLELYDQNIGFQREADRIAAVLQVRPGMTIGDVRAGTGRWTVDLARRVGESGMVYATGGPSPAHQLFATVAEAQVKNVTVVTRPAGDSVRLPDACCDAVLLRHVFRNFDDRRQIVASLYRSLRPGGRLAIIELIGSGATSAAFSTNHVPPTEALQMTTSLGFEVVEQITDWSSNAYCLVLAKPVTASPEVRPRT